MKKCYFNIKLINVKIGKGSNNKETLEVIDFIIKIFFIKIKTKLLEVNFNDLSKLEICNIFINILFYLVSLVFC